MNLIVLLPYIGWILSIVAWVVAKEKSEKIDKQGKNILNWMISYLLYAIAISFILMFITIIGGILTLVVGGIDVLGWKKIHQYYHTIKEELIS